MAKRLLPGFLALSSLTMALLTMGQTEAVELGNFTLQSSSGQPLLATVQLADIEGLRASDIRVSVASLEDFERFSLERIGALDNLDIEVDLSGTSPVLLISSPITINDPFISLVLDTRWPSGRILTEYTIRLESPAFSSQTGASTSVAPVRSMNALLEPETDLDDAAPATVLAVPEGSAAPQVQVADSANTVSAVSNTSSTGTPTAAASAAPTVLSNASTITVNAGDTLWELALRVRPDASVSVQQTMLALQALNPGAFIGGNINRVRRGEILQVPELSEIRRITAAEAAVEVTRQDRLLANGTANLPAQPLVTAPTQPPAGASAQGELRVVTVDEQAPDPQPNADAAGNQSSQSTQQISDLEDRIASGEDVLARLNSENNELNARLAMLQQQISSAQELIRLRDLELARLQQTLAEESAAVATQAEVQNTVITMAPDAGTVQRFIQMVTNNTWAMLGVVAILIVLLVLVLIRRNRAAAEIEAKMNARNDDGMTLGNDTDDLLFSGVAESIDEKTMQVDEQSTDKTTDGVNEQAQFAAAMASAAGNAYQQVEEQTEATKPSVQLAEQEDDWQPADLTDDQPETEVFLDERFDLDDTGHEQSGVPDQLSDEFTFNRTEEAEDEPGYSVEETGADLDWPDEEQQDIAVDSNRVNPALAEFDISEVDDIKEPDAEKTPARPVDNFDDLAFLPADDDFSDQMDVEDDEEFNFATDAEEAATKLDLARVYMDMEDTQGAREILEEVLKEGTEEQRVEARDLLGRL